MKSQTIPISEIELRASICRDEFFFFIQEFWDIVIKEKPVYNWHIPYLCQELQTLALNVKDRQPLLYNLIINIPPGTTKTTITTIMFPVWCWIIDPSITLITGSYSGELSLEHAVKSRDIIRSPKFRSYFPNISIKQDKDTKKSYENNYTGARYATSVGGTVTGKHAHIIMIDDPLNPHEAASDADRKTANDWFDHTLPTRKVDKALTPTILIMQRLHEDDCTGHQLAKKGIKIKHICLPAEVSELVKPRELQAKYKKGLLDPVRLSEEILKAQKIELGSRNYAGQFDQSPSFKEGNIFKYHYWNRYNKLPDHFNYIIDSWDCTFKEKKTSDMVSGTVWGVIDASIYLLHHTMKQLGFADTIKAILHHRKLFPSLNRSLIEDKANGPAIIETLKNSIIGIIPFDPGSRSKEERAFAVEPFLEGKNVYLPVEALATFDVDEYIEILAKFPNAKYDDPVDSTTMALLYLEKKIRIPSLKQVIKQNENIDELEAFNLDAEYDEDNL